MISIMNLQFTELLEKSYMLWRTKKRQGERKSETAFVEWLGFPPNTYWTWKTKSPPKDDESIGRLAGKFKELDKALVSELYEALDIDDPWEIETKGLIERFKDDETFYKAANKLYDIAAQIDERLRKKKK